MNRNHLTLKLAFTSSVLIGPCLMMSIVFKNPDGLKNTINSGIVMKLFVAFVISFSTFGFLVTLYTSMPSTSRPSLSNSEWRVSDFKLPHGNRNGFLYKSLSKTVYSIFSLN